MPMMIHYHFNSRPSARGDWRRFIISTPPFLFQFTPLREGRPAPPRWTAQGCAFQFTPLREGRPAGGGGNLNPGDISIHAPPRGATCPSGRRRCAGRNFNSRPSARGDICTPPVVEWITYFNSRPSARGDEELELVCKIMDEFQFTPLREGRRLYLRTLLFIVPISIHAPPRGATCALVERCI